MPVENTFEQFFKPEARRSGQDFVANNAVVLSNKSDTHIQGYIKGTGSSRVSFSSSSIESSFFTADCSCPISSKGQFCKHIWAILLTTEISYPDFLNSKVSIEKISKVNPKQDAYKEKQADYRKLQYQKQKLQVTKNKLAKEKQKSLEEAPRLSDAAEDAYTFFSENGFPMDRPLDGDALNNARKKLARVFHPDIGGSHEETVVLNKNYEILANLLR